MTRLTKDIRDRIMALALQNTIIKARTQVEEEEHELAEKLYQKYTTKEERDAVALLGDRWVKKERNLSINANGGRIALRFRTYHFCKWGYYDCLILTDKKEVEEIREHARKKEGLKEKQDDAKIALRTLLNSVTTFKRLAEVWPEGQEYWGKVAKAEGKAGLPAIRVEEVNAALGLPKETKNE